MMTANSLMLSGRVYKTLTRKISPLGIPHCHFVLEHRSVQQEAGFTRQAWCRLSVVVSGKQTFDMVRGIMVGAQITAQGFISHHRGCNGLSKIVLHADQIYLIDSGE